MKDIIINGKIYSNISKLNFKNDLGEIVTFVEKSEYIPTTSASLFEFKDNVLTKYLGTETDIVIPASYSKIITTNTTNVICKIKDPNG